MMQCMFASRFACVRVTPFGRDVDPLVNWRNAGSSGAILTGLSVSSDSRMPSTATTCSRAALGHDVSRVVEIGLELPETDRWIDGHGDDARPERAEEAEDEVFVRRQDERDAVALTEAERLESPPVAAARPLERGEGERSLARCGAGAEAGNAGLGDETEAERRVRLGGVLDRLCQRLEARRHEGSAFILASMPLIETEEAARRLARAIASDLSLYNEEKIVNGITNDNLFETLAEEIEEGRALYKRRVAPELYPKNFYDRALVDILVKSKGHIKSKIW
jgi:hypothetical protein